MPSAFMRLPPITLRLAALGEWWQTMPDSFSRAMMARWIAASGCALRFGAAVMTTPPAKPQ